MPEDPAGAYVPVAKADAGAMAVDEVVDDELVGDELHAANPRAPVTPITSPTAHTARCLPMSPTALRSGHPCLGGARGTG